jgi:osmotically-inducible protein OsmY
MSNTSHNTGRAMSQARLACLVALLAVPLAACSDRSAQRETAQAESAQEQDSQIQADTGEGVQQADIEATDTTYTDGYSKPREAWTGGATAENAQFKGSADSDARALAQLEEAFSARDDFSMIEVDVQDGIAHIEGEVESEADRQEAIETAMEVEGVAAVRNELQVARKAD